jgi:hypothetical protein
MRNWNVSIGLAQDRDKWRAPVNVVIAFGFRRMLVGSRVVARPVISRVVLSTIGLVTYYFCLTQLMVERVTSWCTEYSCFSSSTHATHDICSCNIYTYVPKMSLKLILPSKMSG